VSFAAVLQFLNLPPGPSTLGGASVVSLRFISRMCTR
jgi:hypothetical protein